MFRDFKILKRIIRPVKIYNLYHFKPLSGFSIDSRSIKKGEGFIAIKGKYHDGHGFIKQAVAKGAAFVVGEKYQRVSPRVPFFVVESSEEALEKLAAYIRKKKKPFVYGITGSVGKTTVKEILSFLLEPAFGVLKNKGTENNFLGVAKTLLRLRDEKVVILELGTNRQGEIARLARISVPDAGIITAIRPVHLEGLQDLNGVFKEKTALFEVNPGMQAVLNRNDPYLIRLKPRRRICWFGSRKGSDFTFRLKRRQAGKSFFLLQNQYDFGLPYYQEDFIVNFAAGICAARLLKLPLEKLIARARKFKSFSPLRREWREIKGFSVLNDAYNANPYALKQALKSLKSCPLKKIAVIGDMLELGRKGPDYHAALATAVIRNNFAYCITLGRLTPYLRERLKKLGYKKSFHFTSHRAAAGFINKVTGLTKESKKRYLIFLKGSRNMELEKVLTHLK